MYEEAKSSWEMLGKWEDKRRTLPTLESQPGNKWSFRAEVSVVCVFALVHVCMYNHLLWLEARLRTWSSNAETVSGRVAATFLTVERKHVK